MAGNCVCSVCMCLPVLQPTKCGAALCSEVEEFPLPCPSAVGDSEYEAGQQTWKDVWEDLVPGVCHHLSDE